MASVVIVTAVRNAKENTTSLQQTIIKNMNMIFLFCAEPAGWKKETKASWLLKCPGICCHLAAEGNQTKAQICHSHTHMLCFFACIVFFKNSVNSYKI